MNKSTPGPWRIDESGNYDGGHGRCSSAIVGKNGEPIVLFDPSDGEYEVALDPKSANARLIAAAPDLLEALEGMIEGFDVDDRYASEAVLKARAALKKATGEE